MAEMGRKRAAKNPRLEAASKELKQFADMIKMS